MTTPPVLVPLSRHVPEPASRALHRVVTPLALLMHRAVRVDWRGSDNIPRCGCVVASNHLSYFDFLTLSQFLLGAGRWPHFLAKDSIFNVPVLGRILTACEQIPVQRGTARAADALAAAVAAVERGLAVVIYPEGTITKDPDQWPMRGHSGAVRVALSTGCPLVPVAQWGPQQVIPGPGAGWPRLLPRKTIRIVAGAPLDLSEHAGSPVTAELVQALTAQLMARITTLLAELRETTPPTTPPYDPANPPGPGPG